MVADVFKAAALISLGAGEGFLFGRSGLYAPESFRKQMNFESFLLMKLFFTGVGTSMLVQSLMSIYDPKRWPTLRSNQHISNGFRNVIPGCLILGAGMALAGSGPTIIPTQLGMHVDVAPYIMGGALFGGVLWSVLENMLNLRTACPKQPGEKLIVEDYIGGTYHKWAIPAGLALIGGAAGLEAFAPHTIDAAAVGSPAARWLPMAAGAIVGLNQVPIRYISGDGQGGSRSVMNIVSMMTGGKLSNRFFVNSWARSWQLLYVYGGTTLGGYLAYRMYQNEENNNFQPSRGFDPLITFAGGALMVIGARLAGGCTCGHGISGMSELCVQSLAGGAAIFAGGIGTTMALGLNTTPTK